MSADSIRRNHNWLFIAKVMCGQRLREVDAVVLLVAIALEYTSCLWFVFLQVACAIGGVTRATWFA